MTPGDRVPSALRKSARVRCRGEEHVVGLSDGTVVAPAHTSEEIERELTRGASGAPLDGCFAILADGCRERPDQPLRNAIGGGFLDEILMWVRRGADPDTATKAGRTALLVAIEAGRTDVVHELLAAGADPRGRANRSITPLESAARRGHPEIVRALLAAGARPRTRNGIPLELADAAGHLPIIRLLLDAGARPYPEGLYEFSYLERVFTGGDPTMIGSVMEAARSGTDGDTALHTAARNRSLEVVRLLVEAGEDPERKNAVGETPQTIAMTRRRHEIVSLLVTKGADAATGEDATVLHVAVDRGDADLVRDLLNSGADVRARTRTGWTPLLIAADRGRVAITRMLLDAGADPGTRTPDGWTALHIAVPHRHSDIARALLAAGADIESETSTGRTPQGLAAAYGIFGMERLLREAGAAVRDPG